MRGYLGHPRFLLNIYNGKLDGLAYGCINLSIDSSHNNDHRLFCKLKFHLFHTCFRQTHSLLILLSNFRCRRHRCGCCRKIVPKMLKNHCNGFAVGCHRKLLSMNSNRSSDIMSAPILAIYVPNKMSNAHIRRPRSWKKCKS